MELLRQFYSDHAGDPLWVPQRLWTDNPQTTQIWIDTEARWEDEQPKLRPAIYVKLNPTTFESLTGRKDARSGMDLVNGEYEFSRSGTGAVSFVHVGRTAGEAVTLADATMDYFDAFGMVIRNDFCFDSFNLAQRVPLEIREKEARNRLESTVTFAYTHQDRWTLKLESPQIRKLTLRAGQRAAAAL